jgi:hypothetical protein
MLELLVSTHFFLILYYILTNTCTGLNIGADKEAAEHFLSALSLQEATNGDTSDQLWFTLRRALQSMVGLFRSIGRKIIFIISICYRNAMTLLNLRNRNPRQTWMSSVAKDLTSRAHNQKVCILPGHCSNSTRIRLNGVIYPVSLVREQKFNNPSNGRRSMAPSARSTESLDPTFDVPLHGHQNPALSI